jgi:ATP-dependent Lhr-like helicase
MSNSDLASPRSTMPAPVLELFHPAVRAWFEGAFAAPTPAQVQAWPAIQSGRHTLVAAPTGSGKTLAAFLGAIDSLVREAIEGDGLADETRVVYVSPLKALSNDIQRNLEAPIAGIAAELERLGLPHAGIRSAVRTGDTPQLERTQMRRRAPHILVTTPETLYILLTSKGGRKMLANTRSVIVDEIHALAPNKRGAHLALSLERLEKLCGRELTRIGLSATQKPIREIARFLVGDRCDAAGEPHCSVVDTGHVRERDLGIELPPAPLEAVMSGEVWQLVYDRLAALVSEHRTTLIFVNTRRMAERAARFLSERIGAENVAAHHGSLAREHRLQAEQRLKRGELRALVATASLELGIDIGDVDLVCQIGVTRSIAGFLQRVGRSGHAVGGTPKGRLFPLTRDELCDCAALLDCVARGELDRITLPEKPLDVLAQQIVAEVGMQEWREDELRATFVRAAPYQTLTHEEYVEIVRMLCEGYDTRRGRRAAYLHRDAVNGMLRGQRGAALTAVTCGGTIPDNADYQVLLEPQSQVVGTLNEDFAIESLAGDVFQLGNTSYRILRVERGTVRVEDAKGMPPSMPFWLGEAPGRTTELSASVSRLREDISGRLDTGGRDAAVAWLSASGGTFALSDSAAEQITDYLAAAKAALGRLPTQRAIVFERFFDESGGMQFVIHAPLGSRINRAWGLALRKRFCRKFDFELQAAATEDAIILSLSASHSFALEEVAGYLSAKTVRPVLVQALLAAPMFNARWRWNGGVALALPRMRGGRKVAPQLQRMAAEDLLGAIFPDQLACGENIVGDREIPEHPLVRQTIHDCLHEAMDIDALEALLTALASGAVEVIARDLTEPSPLALEILAARPYAFLDDAPLEERRTQAVLARRWVDPQTASDLGKLDVEAIARVRDEIWPDARNANEVHAALLGLGFLSEAEVAAMPSWQGFIEELALASRATRLALGPTSVFVAAERLPEFDAVFPAAQRRPAIEAPAEYRKDWSREAALVEILRDRLQGVGPVTAQALVAPLGLGAAEADAALARLEAEGSVMRGRFNPEATHTEWCERRLLARIHRYTVNRLRREIEPVEPREFMRFLFEWQRVAPQARVEGPDAVAGIVSQLEGFEASAAAWETEILPARVNEYDPAWLDALSRAGRVAWTRIAPLSSRNGGSATLLAPVRGRTTQGVGLGALSSNLAIPMFPDSRAQRPSRAGASGAPSAGSARAASPVRTTPITLVARRHLALWASLAPDCGNAAPNSGARRVLDHIATHGASFFDDIAHASGLLRAQVEDALGELVALGLVNCDSFAGLRALLVPSEKRRAADGRKRPRRTALFGIEDAGRWALARSAPPVRREPHAALGPNPGSGTPADEPRAAHEPNARAGAAPDEAQVAEHVARTLLRRYGVVFWRLISREADWLPPWRDVLRCLRRLEARGEIRGGRFVAGVSGEQFALPEAIGLMRDVRRRTPDGAWVSLSGTDPLNLVGVLSPGPRLPALTGNRVLYRDGIAIALLVAGEVRFVEDLPPQERWAAQNALQRRQVPPLLRVLA